MNFSTPSIRISSLFAIAFLIATQSKSQDLTRSDADIAFQNQQYEKAVKNYKQVVEKNPQDGRSLNRLGFSLLNLKLYDESIAAYKACAKVKYLPHLSYYNIACAYSNKGDTEQALVYLEKSINAGYIFADNILSDVDMAQLLENEKFKKLIDLARNPTSQSPSAELLFSLQGDWEVASTSDGGLMTWVSSPTGYSNSVDLVVGKRRILYLLFNYWGKTKSWVTNGADVWDGKYSGPIHISGKTITINDQAGGPKNRKIEITLVDPLVMNIKFFQLSNGKWNIRREYRLEPKSR